MNILLKPSPETSPDIPPFKKEMKTQDKGPSAVFPGSTPTSLPFPSFPPTGLHLLKHRWQTQGLWAKSGPPPCFIRPVPRFYLGGSTKLSLNC